MTRNQIIKAVGNPHLNLYASDGYFYFVFDNVDINDYDDHSVYVYRLKHLSLSQWINEAQTFLKGIGQ